MSNKSEFSYMLTGGKTWTQEQIDDFMEAMEKETFDKKMTNRGAKGSITEITRENENGEETTYVKGDDGVWEEQ